MEDLGNEVSSTVGRLKERGKQRSWKTLGTRYATQFEVLRNEVSNTVGTFNEAKQLEDLRNTCNLTQ